MRRKTLSTVCAVTLTILWIAGLVVVFYFAQNNGAQAICWCFVGIAFSFAFAPFFHELGHIVFAIKTKMQVVYAKFFCVKFVEKNGKLKMRFASPLRADETQAVPKTGGAMQKRAKLYTIGGLVFGGAFALLVFVLALTLTSLNVIAFLFWGMLPYAVYLFLLNVLPLEYASGKTDALIYGGLKRGDDAEKNMLTAMEIQGLLYEGKSFSEIDESLYFDAPQLAEDEPLFAVILDLRYRYYLEKEEIEKAGDCLNRLINAQAYLTEEELQKLAGECVYVYSLLGDFQRAEESGKLAKPYLAGESAAAKRILATYSAVFGEKDSAEILMRQAEQALQNERIEGVKRFERILLSRISLE